MWIPQRRWEMIAKLRGLQPCFDARERIVRPFLDAVFQAAAAAQVAPMQYLVDVLVAHRGPFSTLRDDVFAQFCVPVPVVQQLLERVKLPMGRPAYGPARPVPRGVFVGEYDISAAVAMLPPAELLASPMEE